MIFFIAEIKSFITISAMCNDLTQVVKVLGDIFLHIV